MMTFTFYFRVDAIKCRELWKTLVITFLCLKITKRDMYLNLRILLVCIITRYLKFWRNPVDSQKSESIIRTGEIPEKLNFSRIKFLRKRKL